MRWASSHMSVRCKTSSCNFSGRWLNVSLCFCFGPLTGERAGFFLGDGAGVGKGRQIAAIIKVSTFIKQPNALISAQHTWERSQEDFEMLDLTAVFCRPCMSVNRSLRSLSSHFMLSSPFLVGAVCCGFPPHEIWHALPTNTTSALACRSSGSQAAAACFGCPPHEIWHTMHGATWMMWAWATCLCTQRCAGLVP